MADKGKMKKLIWDCQKDIATYLPPASGISEHQLLQMLIARLYGSRAKEALGDSPEFRPANNCTCRTTAALHSIFRSAAFLSRSEAWEGSGKGPGSSKLGNHQAGPGVR